MFYLNDFFSFFPSFFYQEVYQGFILHFQSFVFVFFGFVFCFFSVGWGLFDFFFIFVLFALALQ